MDDSAFGRELGKAAIASIVGFLVGLFLQALGATKWVVAAASGAIGGLVAAAVIA
jgi:hypothetical protein